MEKLIEKIKNKIIHLTTEKLPRFFIDPWEKWRNVFPQNLAIANAAKGWSVVVITGGNDVPTLEKVIGSIDSELSGSPAEIVLVGPPKLKLSRQFNLPIKYLAYRDAKPMPPLITRKKNWGVRLCQYDKVVICHDYILFEPEWKKGWDDFGDDFTVAMNIIKNKNGERFRDWSVWDYPEFGQGLLPYAVELTRYQYISGTYMVVKRDFYLANQLDERLRWGGGEDVEWSKRVREKTVFKFNPHSVVRCAKQKEANLGNWSACTEQLEKEFNT